MNFLLSLLLLTCPTFQSSSYINGYQKNISDSLTAVTKSPSNVKSAASSSSDLLRNSNEDVSKQLAENIFDKKKFHDDTLSGAFSDEEYNNFEKSMLYSMGIFQEKVASRRGFRNPCNIERIDLRIPYEVADKSEGDFSERVITNLPDHPVIFVGYSDRNALLARLASMESLMTSPVGV